ncbi:MAG: asparagine synthase [Alphaproteobacteria bacterium]|nr:asparagine synthase [Alphaproteobacteria bacterium]
MSVFAGAVSTHGRPLPPGLADRLSSAIEPYGGNRAVQWSSSHAVLVHRQRVVTPEDALERQPVRDASGLLALVLDGRLDNRDALIAALRLGERASSLPDSRILLAALERWGGDAPGHLLGDFAFALWNAAERRLTLACDHIGGRSIHYHHGDGMVVFATMIHAVQAMPHVPRAMDEQVLADLIMDLGAANDRTVYRGIARVPPAGRVVVAGGSLRVERYWEPDFERRLALKDDEYVEAARELLDQAVACRLRASGRIVAQVTGGLDSSAVASTAARLMAPGVLRTVTAVPNPAAALRQSPGMYTDERPYVEAIARRHPNIEPHFVPAADGPTLEDDPARLFLYTGIPFRGIMNVGWFAPTVAKTRALGASVLLVGGFGNLTLSWDGSRSLADLFGGGRWVRMAREATALARTTGRSTASILRQHAVVPRTPAAIRQLYRRLRGRPDRMRAASSPINPAFEAEWGIAERLRRENRLDPYDTHGGDADHRRHWLNKFTATRAYLAALRAHEGYETRDPLGDLRLIEFCLAVPAEQYLRGGDTRFLARRALADRLPVEVTQNRLVGRQSPDWFHRMDLRRDAIIAELDRLDRSPLARRCLDLPRLKAAAADWPADCEAAERRADEFYAVLNRGIHYGRYLRWIEGGNE